MLKSYCEQVVDNIHLISLPSIARRFMISVLVDLLLLELILTCDSLYDWSIGLWIGFLVDLGKSLSSI